MAVTFEVVESNNELMLTPKSIKLPYARIGQLNRFDIIVVNKTDWDIADFALDSTHPNIAIDISKQLNRNTSLRGTLICDARKLEAALSFDIKIGGIATKVIE